MKILHRLENDFMLTTLPFTHILRVSTVIITLPNHYHILFDVSEYWACFIKKRKPFLALCVFTALRLSSPDTLAMKEEVFQKLLLATEYRKSNHKGILWNRYCCNRTISFANAYQKSHNQNSTICILATIEKLTTLLVIKFWKHVGAFLK